MLCYNAKGAASNLSLLAVMADIPTISSFTDIVHWNADAVSGSRQFKYESEAVQMCKFTSYKFQ